MTHQKKSHRYRTVRFVHGSCYDGSVYAMPLFLFLWWVHYIFAVYNTALNCSKPIQIQKTQLTNIYCSMLSHGLAIHIGSYQNTRTIRYEREKKRKKGKNNNISVEDVDKRALSYQTTHFHSPPPHSISLSIYTIHTNAAAYNICKTWLWNHFSTQTFVWYHTFFRSV